VIFPFLDLGAAELALNRKPSFPLPCDTRQGPSRPFKGHAGAESLTGHVLRASRSLGSIGAETDGPASCHKADSFMPRLLMASPRVPRPHNPRVGVQPPGNACGRPLGPCGGYCGTPHERRCLPSPGQRPLGPPGPPRAGHPRAESPAPRGLRVRQRPSKWSCGKASMVPPFLHLRSF